jgi:hypothetical protein
VLHQPRHENPDHTARPGTVLLAAERPGEFHQRMPRSHLAVLRHVAALEQPWNVTGEMEDWPAMDEFERTGLIEARRLRAHGVGNQITVLGLTGAGVARISELEKTETSKGIIAVSRWKIYGVIVAAIVAVLVRYISHLMTK